MAKKYNKKELKDLSTIKLFCLSLNNNTDLTRLILSSKKAAFYLVKF